MVLDHVLGVKHRPHRKHQPLDAPIDKGYEGVARPAMGLCVSRIDPWPLLRVRGGLSRIGLLI